MSAEVRTAHLEALRTTCLAAVTSAQAALQHVEALIAGEDADESSTPPAEDFSSLTFDESPAPSIRRPNGKRR